ncbi:MAG: hypothetical protein QOD77_443 [Thermoplasmata archaeon]|jgi:hypothetical protein|nr:hypothetical protein [Thermoplasmata archaeon]
MRSVLLAAVLAALLSGCTSPEPPAQQDPAPPPGPDPLWLQDHEFFRADYTASAAGDAVLEVEVPANATDIRYGATRIIDNLLVPGFAVELEGCGRDMPDTNDTSVGIGVFTTGGLLCDELAPGVRALRITAPMKPEVGEVFLTARVRVQ